MLETELSLKGEATVLKQIKGDVGTGRKENKNRNGFRARQPEFQNFGRHSIWEGREKEGKERCVRPHDQHMARMGNWKEEATVKKILTCLPEATQKE